jgi:transposase
MDTLTLTAWQRRRLQRQLRMTHDARLYRRTLTVLEVSQGQPVAAVARRLGVTPRAIYYWLGNYAQAHDPAALLDGDRPGRPALLTKADRDRLRDLLLSRSPQELGYFATDWTVPLLRDHLAHRTGRWLADDTIRRELQRQGFVWKRCRYALDPDPELWGKKATHPLADTASATTQRGPGRG